jgi:hypothetical protein
MAVSKPLVAAILSASLVTSALFSQAAVSQAAALPLTGSQALHAEGGPIQIDYRRGWRGGRGGGGLAILGGLLIGGAIVAAAIAENRASDGAMRRCAANYRSFDPRSGTYIDRNGDVRVCPYLY